MGFEATEPCFLASIKPKDPTLAAALSVPDRPFRYSRNFSLIYRHVKCPWSQGIHNAFHHLGGIGTAPSGQIGRKDPCR